MKTKILVGAVAMVMWGGAALAGDRSANKDCPEPGASAGVQTDADVGIGGSGLVEDSDSSMSTSSDADAQDVYGGSGDLQDQESSDVYGGSGDVSDAPVDNGQGAAVPAPSTTIIVTDDDDDENQGSAISAAPANVETKEQKLGDNRGLTLLLGGGIEGYSGDLAPQLDPGVSWGVTAAIKPTSVIGLELTYSGAANESAVGGGNLTSGADIIRNGGEAAVTVGLTPTSIQPYILGGVGLNRYNVRAGDGAGGFRDDTSGNIPLGAGLRTHIGDFTADARVNYNVLFDQEFAPAGEEEILGADGFSGGGRYNGMVRLGTTF